LAVWAGTPFGGEYEEAERAARTQWLMAAPLLLHRAVARPVAPVAVRARSTRSTGASHAARRDEHAYGEREEKLTPNELAPVAQDRDWHTMGQAGRNVPSRSKAWLGLG
jgi:hypothetical protein